MHLCKSGVEWMYCHFFILIFYFTEPLQATVVLRLYFASLMSLHYVTICIEVLIHNYYSFLC